MIENDQIMLLPMKIIEIVLYALVLLSLNKKYKDTKFLKRPALHQFFVLGIGAWIYYMMFDTIIYVIAPMSIPSIPAGVDEVIGYSSEYSSLFIANILRDFAIIGAVVMAWFYCSAAVKINKGINFHSKLFGSKKVLISTSKFEITLGHLNTFFAGIILIIIIINDKIKVMFEGDIIHVTSTFGIATLINLAFFTFSAVIMVRQMIYIRNTPLDEEYKHRARNLARSIILFTFGLYYWGLTAALVSQFSSLSSLSLIFLYLGHIIWASSAIFIYFAFKSQKISQNSEE